MTVTFRGGWRPTPPERPRVVLTRAIRVPDSLPPQVDYGSGIPDIGMHLNDTWGDCTCAACANIVQQQTFFGQGNEVIVPDSAVLTEYAASGFDVNAGPPGGNPTDNGWTCADALSYLKKTGLVGHTIAGYGQLATSNRAILQTAVSEFGGLYLGMAFPSSAMDQFNNDQDWDIVANDGGIEGGHAVYVNGYDGIGYWLWTWGKRIRMTYAFFDRYVGSSQGEAWGVISRDWVSAASGKDPEGVDLVTLGQEFLAVTGQNPFPAPAPQPGPPGPSPDPGPPPSPPPPSPSPSPEPAPAPNPGCLPGSKLIRRLLGHDSVQA